MTASIRHLLLTLGAAVLLFLGLAAPPAAATPGTPASPANWPTGLLPAVAEELGREAPWRPEATPQGAQATNTRHGLQARFDAQGLHLETDAGAVRLALAGFGRDGELAAPAAAEAEVEGARVLYRHGPHLTQWFLNSPLGLEQGFTLAQRPEGQGELRLALTLTGDLKPRLDADELVFADRAGNARLRYGALTAFDAAGTKLPARMSLHGERLVLAVDDTGAQYPVVVDPLFSEEAKLTADDGKAGDHFGISVAMDGNTVLIGSENGAAYVFVRGSGVWTLQRKLTKDDFGFGTSVALSGDTALIGAYGANDNKGAAYVFVREAGVWSEQAMLIATDGALSDAFGVSVAIDGDTALIGADRNGDEYAGAAYLFERKADGTWSEQQKLTGGAVWGLFGASVALAGDTALIGAYGVDNSKGAAYVFVLDGAGHWTQQGLLTADNGGAGDYFGTSVALSGDTALVGAPEAGSSGQGAAYVFTRNGTGWQQTQILTATDGVANDYFGKSVALAGDTALVGAPSESGVPGAAYLFMRETNGTWGEPMKLTASNGVAWDLFGESVALAGDTALVGARGGNKGDPDAPAVPSAAYIFDSPVDLALVKQVDTNPVRQGNTFGYSLHVTNNAPEVDATGVTLTDPRPEGVIYVGMSHVTGDCEISEVTVTCALGTLAKDGGTASVHITVRADAAPGTLITNTASVAADQPDANPDDNTDSVDTLVNTAPVADDLAFTVEPGAVYSGTLPAADANGDALTFAIVENGTLGTVEITDAATGAFTYTPHAEASGTDSFTFKVNDGTEDSNIATVTVTIQPAPNPVPDDGNSNSGGGGGGAFSPLVLLLGLAAVARRRTWQPDVSNCWQTRSRRTVSW
jgi:uncharacterized repeat protein (TIGR01451 family)